MVIQLETLNRDGIFTARKRSLGQGNIFTGVRLSTAGGCCKHPRRLSTFTEGGGGRHPLGRHSTPPPSETATEAGILREYILIFVFLCTSAFPVEHPRGVLRTAKDQIFPPRGGGGAPLNIPTSCSFQYYSINVY